MGCVRWELQRRRRPRPARLHILPDSTNQVDDGDIDSFVTSDVKRDEIDDAYDIADSCDDRYSDMHRKCIIDSHKIHDDDLNRHAKYDSNRDDDCNNDAHINGNVNFERLANANANDSAIDDAISYTRMCCSSRISCYSKPW